MMVVVVVLVFEGTGLLGPVLVVAVVAAPREPLVLSVVPVPSHEVYW